MSLIIATGSNQGDRQSFLEAALKLLKLHFDHLHSSRVYESPAYDYLHQDNFLNQVHEFLIPNISPQEALRLTQKLEIEVGRIKTFDKGPRTIDIDIIFWGLETIQSEHLIIPHPQWIHRSFVVKPLQELPFFKILENSFKIPKSFEADAFPIKT